MVDSSKRVVVTGIGAISAAGNSVVDLEHSLLDAPYLFGKPQRITRTPEVVVAEIQADKIPGPLDGPFDTMSGRFSLQAARECIQDAGFIDGRDIDGLIVGTSAAGQEKNEDFVFSFLSGNPRQAYDFHRKGVVASPSKAVAHYLEIYGPVMTISTACTSSANAIVLGSRWIEEGRCQRVLAGGCDDLCSTTISGFRSLLLTGPEHCRPFGKDRPGMTLGEGAAFLLLESQEKVIAEGRPYIAEIIGYGLSADAYHMTAPRDNGEGAVKAMQAALNKGHLKNSDISWINAHGTGTELNDKAESAAISHLFADTVPVSSNKGLFGHTLGAAGALEAVVCCLALRNKWVPPNYQNNEAAPDCPISLVGKRGMKLEQISFVLSNSFGFGGSNCALIFGKGRSIP